MKKQWNQPMLEVLDIKQTMLGSPNEVDDFFDTDGETLHGPS
jgi:hypothetical protein